MLWLSVLIGGEYQEWILANIELEDPDSAVYGFSIRVYTPVDKVPMISIS